MFRQYIDRYHYLGYRVPFGVHLRYLVESQQLPGRNLACLQFSSPAWKMAPRHAYSIFGGPCYDPISLFLLALFRYLDKISDVKHFCGILRDPKQGQSYHRGLAGLRDESVPCRATFINFRACLGESRYQEIFHTLVSLVEKLGLLSHNIQATDRTLFPSAARYRRSCHYNDSCGSISVDNFV